MRLLLKNACRAVQVFYFLTENWYHLRNSVTINRPSLLQLKGNVLFLNQLASAERRSFRKILPNLIKLLHIIVEFWTICANITERDFRRTRPLHFICFYNILELIGKLVVEEVWKFEPAKLFRYYTTSNSKMGKIERKISRFFNVLVLLVAVTVVLVSSSINLKI